VAHETLLPWFVAHETLFLILNPLPWFVAHETPLPWFVAHETLLPWFVAPLPWFVAHETPLPWFVAHETPVARCLGSWHTKHPLPAALVRGTRNTFFNFAALVRGTLKHCCLGSWHTKHFF
jgi:hypothetical protein